MLLSQLSVALLMGGASALHSRFFRSSDCFGAFVGCLNMPQRWCCDLTQSWNAVTSDCTGVACDSGSEYYTYRGGNACNGNRFKSDGGVCHRVASGQPGIAGASWIRRSRKRDEVAQCSVEEDPATGLCMGKVEPSIIGINGRTFWINGTMSDDMKSYLKTLWEGETVAAARVADLPAEFDQYEAFVDLES